MSFLGYYDDLVDDDSVSNNNNTRLADGLLHIIFPNDVEDESESSLGMTIVSSAPSSFEEEIVFEWPLQQSQHAEEETHRYLPMSISTKESSSASLTMMNSEEPWILTSSPQDMCLDIPCDDDHDEINSGSTSQELSLHPSSVPSSDIHSSDLWTRSSVSSQDSHDDDTLQQQPTNDDEHSWEHIHRVCQDDCGVYLQTSNDSTSSTSIVTAPWSTWYQRLSTEDEWEDMKGRIQDIFLAFQPHDYESYTADELLALWIEQEEDLFWNKKDKEERPYYWGEAVAVAVASLGVLLLRRS